MFSELVKNNYNEILLAAKRITRRKDYRQATELINETYLTLFEKPIPNPEKFLERFSSAMRLVYIGKRSSYGKATRFKESTLEYDPGSNEWTQIELDCEGQSDETKDTLQALSHLNREDAIEFVKLMEFKESLPPHEREIFSLHFEQRMSSRNIADRMERDTGWKMSYVRYNEMINSIKKKLHEHS